MFKHFWRVAGFCLLVTATLYLLLPTSTLATPSSHSSILLAQAASRDDVNAIASATTVFINENLESQDGLQSGTEYAGSGVIVAVREDSDSLRTNCVYSVLTNAHVVKLRAGDPEQPYGLRTSDGLIHSVQKHRFLGNVETNAIQGLDLALIEFMHDCQQPYPIATIAPPSNPQPNEAVLVSGWLKPASPTVERRRLSSSGKVTAVKPPEPQGGMSLVYDVEQVGVGMSGGPVFNAQGELMGIHSAQVEDGNFTKGQAVQLQQALQEIQRQGSTYNFKVAPPTISSSLIAELVRSLSPSADVLTPQQFQAGFDVSPTDWVFQSAQSLRDRYGCLQSFPDGSYRLKVETTRGQFAIDLGSCVQKLEEVLTASTQDLVKPQELQTSLNTLQQAITDLEQEVQSLRR
ncbi:trypsin-like peptidase domain-containing protein [Pantanalinema rosaneae CENA516]|uniref:S1 family peptidase n=1 Tax=Pantanalinema rosaneae TaxID=1620701 RepID=UPI003D6F3796